MEEKEVILTQEGYNKLEEQLNHLKTVVRTEIAERIKVARGFGDLSENSEYDEAKNAQAENEQAIVELEAQLRNAKIINEKEKISYGCLIFYLILMLLNILMPLMIILYFFD